MKFVWVYDQEDWIKPEVWIDPAECIHRHRCTVAIDEGDAFYGNVPGGVQFSLIKREIL